jgi:O-antigen/teichoic acid export membrane protein
MAAGGAALNIALNLVLIPRMQAEGAAWAALTSQVLTAVVQLLLAVRAQRLVGMALIALRALTHGAVLIGMAWLIDGAGLALHWAAALFAPAAMASAWATGLLRPKELRAALAERG